MSPHPEDSINKIERDEDKPIPWWAMTVAAIFGGTATLLLWFLLLLLLGLAIQGVQEIWGEIFRS